MPALSRATALRGIAIVLLTLLAYLPALRGGFVWDDDDYVTQNETLEDLHGLQRIWFEPGATPQYYPLVHTSFWIERHLWGLDPRGYHAVNVLLHALAAVLLWRLLLDLSVPGAFLAALLFALHPVAVESVAWITERKNVLAGVFYFAAAIAWFRFTRGTDEPIASRAAARPRKKGAASRARDQGKGTGGELAGARARPAERRWYAVSFLLYVLALLSKTVTMTLPVTLLLVAWWKRGRIARREALATIPFFLAGALLAFNTAWMERTRVGATGADWSLGVMDRVLIAGRAPWFYLQKLFWPADLSFVYPRWQVDPADWLQWLFPLGLALAAGALFVARTRIGRGPIAALASFVATLGPALGFVNTYPMRFSFVADHFQYFASASVLAFVGAVLVRVPKGLALVVPLALGGLTWRQAHDYRDLETLWTATLSRNPGAWLADNNLGMIYLERGDLDRAGASFRRAIALKPDYYEALANLGTVLIQTGDLDEARQHNDVALRVSPGYLPALVNRGAFLVRDGKLDDAMRTFASVLRQDSTNADALNGLGAALASSGQFEQAVRAFDAALRLKPTFLAARLNRVRALIRIGRFDDADQELNRVTQAAPDSRQARNLAGELLLARGRPEDAAAHFRALVERDSTDATARFSLGTLLSQAGRHDEAIAFLEAAVRLQPGYTEAWNNLGIALSLAGRWSEAADRFTEALRLRQDNPDAHRNLGLVLVRLGRRSDAIAHLREAVRLRPDDDASIRELRALGVSIP